MATSPIYNWPEPDNTDLVKNGALAMRTLGDAIDTTMATMVPKSIVDAKGDLIAGTAADTTSRLAVGNNGETLVADSSTATGLRWQGDYSAGKNKVINGDFGIWQRGTSFSSPTSGSYTADRWVIAYDGTGATRTISQQTFTAGTAPVAGYEGTYFYRWATSVAGTSNTYNVLATRLEDVRLLAGQTVTLSFWAKADATRTVAGTIRQYFGSGGSTQVDTSILATTNLTTGWVRYTATVALPSISGKTIGTGSYLQVMLYLSANTTMTIDVWGLQVEAGSVATAFQTATGTIQGELAACQRYYVSWNRDALVTDGGVCNGFTSSGTSQRFYMALPVVMRTTPTVLDYSTLQVNYITGAVNISSLTFTAAVNNRNTVAMTATASTGLAALVPVFLNVSSSGYIGIGAEL